MPSVGFLLPFLCRLAVGVAILPGGLGDAEDPSPAGDGKDAQMLLRASLAQESRPSSLAASPAKAGVCPGADGRSGALSPFCRQRRGSFTSLKMGTRNGVTCALEGTVTLHRR